MDTVKPSTSRTPPADDVGHDSSSGKEFSIAH